MDLEIRFLCTLRVSNYKKVLFLCVPHPEKTSFNYSQIVLPDWWINIPPASSYWQAPSLITEHTDNSVSICYQDNNGSGLLNSPHTGFLLLSVILYLLPPSLHLEVFSFFMSWSMSLWGFFPQSGLEAMKPSRDSRLQTGSGHRADQCAAHQRSGPLQSLRLAHMSIWSNASRKYI